MIYSEFLAYVLTPFLLAVTVFYLLRRGTRPDPLGLRIVAGLVVVAVVFTTPWDSWLIKNTVWGYPPGSVLGTVYRVPIEEYLFMFGQTILTGLWTLAVASPPRPVRSPRRVPPALGWLGLAAAGVTAALIDQHLVYLGVTLAWFGPPLAAQSLAGSDVLRAMRSSRLTGLALTPALWAADALAIHLGAWQISPAHTTGLSLFGLPIEEAIFFLATNLLIVNTVLLVGHPVVRHRLTTLVQRRRATQIGV